MPRTLPRTFLRNTTALAVGLGVVLPQIGTAQPAPAADATSIFENGSFIPAPASTATGTAPVMLAQAEVEATAADAVPLPADMAQPEEVQTEDAVKDDAATPPTLEAENPVVVEDVVVNEPATEEGAAADADAEAAATPVVTPEPAVEAVAEPASETPVSEAEAASEAPAPVAEAAEPPAPDTAPEPKVDAQPQADAAADPVATAVPAVAEVPAPEAVVEPEPVTPVEAPVVASPKPVEAGAPVVTDAPSEAELARALAEKNSDAAKPADVPQATPAADSAANSKAPVVGAADADAVSKDAVAPTLPAAVSDAATDVTAAAPADAVSPAKDAADSSDAALAAALAGAREVPEADARTTDAAREAAAAATVPAAVALAESAAPVATGETREVTKDAARSATQDFQTDIRGALREGTAPVVVGADGKPVAEENAKSADKDDDRSNVEKVLRQAVLPALAGLAVGQLLSNDRQVALNTGDRVVVTRPDGSQEIIKDDNVLLLRPGSTVQNDEYADGSTRTIVTREDGSQVVTIRDADLRVLRRTLMHPDGTTTALIDETTSVAPVDVAALPPPAKPVVVAPGKQLSEDELRDALRRETQVDRSFTLGQIRNIPEVRALVAPVDIHAITFNTGSAAIDPGQAQALSSLGRVIADSVKTNPSEIYLIEGHTDTVGADAMNLALSDRRAESVALALTEFFGVPPENMIVQGYGEQFLRVGQEGDVRANRRASVRRITDLLARN